MDSAPHRTLHPLLLDPQYWRNRLAELDLAQRRLLMIPRLDLSCPGLDVTEIRFRTHDGLRLWGLVGRSSVHRDERPARVRLVGPSTPPDVDAGCVEDGCLDVVVQEVAGRRLEDRVLDLLRVLDLARRLDGVDSARVRLEPPVDEHVPDEYRIAEELRSGGLVGSGRHAEPD